MTDATKSSKTRWVLVTAAVVGVVALGVVLTATAFPGGPHMMRGPGFMMDGPGPMRMFHMMGELELTTEQRNTIGEIMDDAMPKARKLGFALMDNHKALRELAVADPFDVKAAEKTANDIGDKVAQLTLLTTSSAANMRAVLSGEQRQRFDEIRSKHRRHHGKRGRHHNQMDEHTPPQD